MSSTAASMNDFVDDEEGGLSGFTILAILVTLIVVFSLVVWYAYQQGKASAAATAELPQVAANPSPVAEDVPLDATRDGGRQEVYDRVSGSVETRVVTQENPGRDPLDGYGGAPASMTPREAPATATSEPAREDPVVAAITQNEEPARTVQPPSRNPRTQTQTQTQPAQRQPVRVTEAGTAAATTAATQTPARAAPAAMTGTHVVQVGAFDSNSAALDYFDGLSRRLGTSVSSKLPDIQVAEVNGRTYHRLRIGPFTSKAEADRYCADLKTRGQDCLVRGV
ncbi:SPOR domain-containing protein [Parvularcula sp. ZS-1/3]|uniref:SPOR domain-containing protein n=1 Tax=Parvularcula mediterranea TaxID=2732508 RepID=A0A7Y3RLJ3_9PROT|nr:SPOR domain-containing protein [Parvularcula mediterranea]NNU16319.1 SPOR domain-containing protein [Parvularcula mediterranea]